jgi:cytidylate kinase
MQTLPQIPLTQEGLFALPLPAVIAVDGPAGSGKSTISYKLAERYGYLFIDTGVFYRTMTLIALRTHTPLDDPNALAVLTNATHIRIVPEHNTPNHPYRVFVNDDEVTYEIRSKEVEAYVSTLSAIAQVREALVLKQREAASQGKVIMAGRDIGTVVLPNADLKLYIDASLEERARRRYLQLSEKGVSREVENIREEIRLRDKSDSEREVSPLKQAPDAHYISTDSKTIDEVVGEIAEKLANWQSV